ncbi:PREDICTED: signal-transducing adaptor protein 2 [Rhinopithecus bieti]|uniref:signal-transducing adaptor protein 2 n=1 Tax=Rhinopithecus bieti TaxID=61621 RepID=UPI00083BF10B|nr:PREDICTED: signal-transducing adaptor protein 2 [Rhinopithecus bieti]
MASAVRPPRVPKPKGVLPSHYYESFLEKKGSCDRDYKKFWAGLQGLTIYFYNSNRDFQHVEKLNLGAFEKLTDEIPWGSSRDPGTHFSLVLRNQEIKFKVETLECREMWKGFILTVVEVRAVALCALSPILQISSKSLLLAGRRAWVWRAGQGLLGLGDGDGAGSQRRRGLRAEERTWSPGSQVGDAALHRCFLKVSRLEAQLLLERYPECGNLLLRPSGDGADGVSVTTRQMHNGTHVVRHYKVKREGPKYVIDVEEPFSCTSLDAVVNYFVSHTKKALVPFLLDEDYEKVLGYVEADKENGESVWVALSALGPGPAPCTGGPKPLPPTSVPVSSQDKLPLLPPLPPLPNQEENYVTPIGDAPVVDYENQDVASSSRPVIVKPKKLPKAPAKLPKPPVGPKPEPRVFNGGLARKLPASSAQPLFPTAGLADMTAELQKKLEKRRALEH